MNQPGNPATATHPEVQISATNFGPIVSGTVDLRPLTVFVGPSNTGKTYFATLIYASHRLLDGFWGLPGVYSRRSRFWESLRHDKPATEAALGKEELQDVIEKLETEGRPFRFSDLPESIRNLEQAALEDPELLGVGLKKELEDCFDIESVSDLVRFSGRPGSMKVSLDVSEEGRSRWRFRLGISESGITTDGRIEDMVLFPEEGTLNDWICSQLRELSEESRSSEAFYNLLYVAAASALDSAPERDRTHYLPAARGGIMESHRVIASSLMRSATRAGLEHLREIPTLSSVVANFLYQLTLYDEGRATNKRMNALADALESETLAGQIRTNRPQSGGYPEFAYRPQGTEEDIRLNRASSMVSELAPVVLFLRGIVGRGDMLIIEEPEAHLHPAVQTQMAVSLARMVRAGVRVVVTTHSDWLLQQIGNLMREGELGEKTGESTEEGSLPSSLRPSDVGVWLFRRDGTSEGSTVEEIKFNRIEGVEPSDYEDVAEELYNRSADLQNRLEETADGAEREHE